MERRKEGKDRYSSGSVFVLIVHLFPFCRDIVIGVLCQRKLKFHYSERGVKSCLLMTLPWQWKCWQCCWSSREQLARTQRGGSVVSRHVENNNSLLQSAISVNTPGISVFPHKNSSMDIPPVKEKKRVKLVAIAGDSEVLCERSGSTPDSSRSVPSLLQVNRQTSPSLYLSLHALCCLFYPSS